MKLLTQSLRIVVFLLAGIAGLAIVIAMLVTCTDVVMRKAGHPLRGAYDIVRIAATVAISCSLPYTTAIKGHVAIEFLYRSLGQRGRIILDTILRSLITALFSLLSWQFVLYGAAMKKSGEVSMTLEIPVFWIPYVMAGSCGVVVLITVYHLFHPGKALLNT